MIVLGADALFGAKLLAIFLLVGVAGKSAVDLARDLLKQFGSLNGIFATSEQAISQVHGIKRSKYVQFQAIFQMSCRALNEKMQVIF